MAVVAVQFGDAHGGGFIEPRLGLAFPVADDDYEDATDESLKLGVNVGLASRNRGIDFAFDFTPINEQLSNAFVDVDVSRFRFQVGGRLARSVGKRAWLVGRIAGGLDIIRYHAQGSLLGIQFESSETDVGIAAEVSGGLMFGVSRNVSVGGWLAVPMAFHFEGNDPNDPDDADLDYVGIDIDFMFVATIRL